MSINKNNIVALSFLVIVALLYGHCGGNKGNTKQSHYVDTTLSRKAQIELCGSCHKTVYENWKIGPHANAHLSLKMHSALIDTSGNFPHEYKDFVKDKMEPICITCHTGKNLYEHNFKGINHANSISEIKRDSFPEAYKQAFGRSVNQKDDLMSGVDCITCHVENNNVITNINSTSSDTSGLIKSNFFSSNMNCYSCHFHQVRTMTELVASKKLAKEINCVSCHQEYDSHGKGTHYFYWRNNPTVKSKPVNLDIFEDVKLSLEGNRTLNFNWTNKRMPHGFSECGEAKCLITAVYKNNNEELVLEKYINRKDFFDQQTKMPPHFRVGKNGEMFDYLVPIIAKKEIKDLDKITTFKILGYVKPQYWSSELEFIKVFEREIKSEELFN